MLAMIMRNLRTPEVLRPALIELGQQHAARGIQPEHYPVVRDHLVAATGDMLGWDWSDGLADDWRAAIDAVAAVMREGHKLAPAELQAP